MKGRFKRVVYSLVYSLGVTAYLSSGGIAFAQQNSQVQPIPQASTTLKWEDFVKRIPLNSLYHYQMITLNNIDQDKKNTDRYKNGLVYISDHSPLLYRPLMEVNTKSPTPWEIHFLFAPILLNRTLPIPGINKPYLEYIRELYLEEIKANTQKHNRDLLSLYNNNNFLKFDVDPSKNRWLYQINLNRYSYLFDLLTRLNQNSFKVTEELLKYNPNDHTPILITDGLLRLVYNTLDMREQGASVDERRNWLYKNLLDYSIVHNYYMFFHKTALLDNLLSAYERSKIVDLEYINYVLTGKRSPTLEDIKRDWDNIQIRSMVIQAVGLGAFIGFNIDPEKDKPLPDNAILVSAYLYLGNYNNRLQRLGEMYNLRLKAFKSYIETQYYLLKAVPLEQIVRVLFGADGLRIETIDGVKYLTMDITRISVPSVDPIKLFRT
ncbi:MAG: hypothetical protein QXQ78_03190, partial [Candidatus Anstonellales archaeon]